MWTNYIYLAERFGAFEIRILRYCLGTSLEEHKTNQQGIRQEVNVMSVLDRMRKKLQLFGHVCRKKRNKDIRRVYAMRVEGRRNRRHRKHRLKDTAKKDLQSLGEEDAHDRIRWKRITELCLRQAPVQDKAEIGEDICTCKICMFYSLYNVLVHFEPSLLYN